MIINILWLVLKTYILQSLSKNYVLIFLKSKNFKSPNWMTYTFVVNTLTHCASRKITILGKKKFRKLYCFLWFWSEVRQKMEVQHTTLTNKDIYEGILRFSWLDGNVGFVIKICLGVLQLWNISLIFQKIDSSQWHYLQFTIAIKIVIFIRIQEYKLEKHMIKSTEKNLLSLQIWPCDHQRTLYQ